MNQANETRHLEPRGMSAFEGIVLQKSSLHCESATIESD
jgi:hypothetical protein